MLSSWSEGSERWPAETVRSLLAWQMNRVFTLSSRAHSPVQFSGLSEPLSEIPNQMVVVGFCCFILRKHTRTCWALYYVVATCFVNISTREFRFFFGGGGGWWGSWILKQCFSLKAIPLHFHLHIDYCWTGQAVSKCIFKLLSNFSVPLAAYGWNQWKWSGRVLLLQSENLKMS